jgi:D-glycero-D-manno-heptose 1,7-bisphosphate phosphatase
LDPAVSWLIGDILDDVEAGHAAGCRAIMLNRGHETEWVMGPRRWPDRFARDLSEAADLILESAALPIGATR